MSTTTYDSMASFEADARARGFDEVLERSYPPNARIATHTHNFGAWAQVSRGEMWLTVDGRTQHLRPGDQFRLDPETPHDELYGDEGAAYWVARRNPR